jgi:hypothetical protein
MNIRKVAAVSVTLAAAATVAVAANVATSASAATHSGTQPVSVTAAAGPAVGGGAGWQGEQAYTPTTGTPSLYYHYSCPNGMIASNGGYDVDAAIAGANYAVGANSPRWDSGYNQWQWYFSWPSGAPAGFMINFDVYCTAGPA